MHGKRIAILESRFGDHLAGLLRRHGAQVLQAPALAEQPDVDETQIAELIDSLTAKPAYLYLFQTGVGTRAIFDTTDRLGKTKVLIGLLAQAKVGARGPKPSAVLRGRGVRIDCAAGDPFTTTELLAAIDVLDIRGKRVVVQRYGETNTGLAEALAHRGASVSEISTYRWALPADTGPIERLVEALCTSNVDAVVFTSASQVRNLFRVAAWRNADETLPLLLNKTLVASIGPVCSKALRESGVAVGLEARPPKLGPLVEALSAAMS
jgi:uroporphyrinogen-III synthase